MAVSEDVAERKEACHAGLAFRPKPSRFQQDSLRRMLHGIPANNRYEAH